MFAFIMNIKYTYDIRYIYTFTICRYFHLFEQIPFCMAPLPTPSTVLRSHSQHPLHLSTVRDLVRNTRPSRKTAGFPVLLFHSTVSVTVCISIASDFSSKNSGEKRAAIITFVS